METIEESKANFTLDEIDEIAECLDYLWGYIMAILKMCENYETEISGEILLPLNEVAMNKLDTLRKILRGGE